MEIGNPEKTTTYGFPLEFIPMNIGAGMTLDCAFSQRLFSSGFKVTPQIYGALAPNITFEAARIWRKWQLLIHKSLADLNVFSII